MSTSNSIQSDLKHAVAPVGLLMERLLREDTGQDLIEYALIFTFVALGAVASMRSLGTMIATVFATIGTTLTTAT